MFSSASKPKPASNTVDRRRALSNDAPAETPSTPSLREMITKVIDDLREAHGSTSKSINFSNQSEDWKRFDPYYQIFLLARATHP
jgi:hypothetical protein